jgi:hypothetical protein
VRRVGEEVRRDKGPTSGNLLLLFSALPWHHRHGNPPVVKAATREVDIVPPRSAMRALLV